MFQLTTYYYKSILPRCDRGFNAICPVYNKSWDVMKERVTASNSNEFLGPIFLNCNIFNKVKEKKISQPVKICKKLNYFNKKIETTN